MSTADTAACTRGRRPKDLDLVAAIGFRIRSRRKGLKLSVSDLAARLGLSVDGVYFWERGEAAPSPAIIPGLCRALEFTPNDLFGWGQDDA